MFTLILNTISRRIHDELFPKSSRVLFIANAFLRLSLVVLASLACFLYSILHKHFPVIAWNLENRQAELNGITESSYSTELIGGSNKFDN